MWNISYEKPINPRWIDKTGQVFGRLTVVSFNHIKRSEKKGSYSYWNCICECGIEVSVASQHLVNGGTVSCGCYNNERVIKANTKHGLSEHPLYGRCENILLRCYNQNHKSFHHYGGREQSDPIFVQESWRNDIGLMVKEIEAEIGLPPFKEAQIDRDNNDLGYESGNIRWVTPEENGRNKRNTHNHCIHPITRKPTPTYNAWHNIIRKHGDEVCIEWRSDGNPDTDNGFKAFYRDMGEKPRKISPIKRYDESKPFCKENCYWG